MSTLPVTYIGGAIQPLQGVMTMTTTAPALVWDSALIRRYNQNGPRYTSYPSALQFHEDFDAKAYARALTDGPADAPLSIYIHIPFCARLCYYCACNKVITKDRRRSQTYLQYLKKEMHLVTAQLAPGRPVTQIHLGGGTPTFLDDEEMAQLIQMLREHFTLLDNTDPAREYAIEVDPRALGPDTIPRLARLGFNRMSIGVQDFDPRVQKAVNRLQSVALTREVMEQARAHGFASLNLDLIYGLPYQTVTSFRDTLDQVIALRPDRLSVFNYAHLPHVFKPQRSIATETLPNAEEKLAILHLAIERLTQAGYVYIGMDHFALPEDALARAREEGKLHRNFQGYSTQSDCDLIGLGVSAISKLDSGYAQNQKELDAYYAALDAHQLPTWRGYALEADDRIRRDVIMELICQGELDTEALGRRHGIEFDRYFAPELKALVGMVGDGLVRCDGKNLGVTGQGRLLLRNICTVFDRYLSNLPRQHYSKML